MRIQASRWPPCWPPAHRTSAPVRRPFQSDLPPHWGACVIGPWGSALQGRGHVSHQGMDRRGSNPVQEHPVQPSTRRGQRRPVHAGQRHPGALAALGGQPDVGIEHREQSAGNANGFPAHPHSDRVVSVHRIQDPNPHPPGYTRHVTQHPNPRQVFNAVVVGGLRSSVKPAITDQIRQPHPRSADANGEHALIREEHATSETGQDAYAASDLRHSWRRVGPGPSQRFPVIAPVSIGAAAYAPTHHRTYCTSLVTAAAPERPGQPRVRPKSR
jgi:hypothetical protein